MRVVEYLKKRKEKNFPIQVAIKATGDSQSGQDFSQVFENEKGQRVSRLFELLKLQDENDCEILMQQERKQKPKEYRRF